MEEEKKRREKKGEKKRNAYINIERNTETHRVITDVLHRSRSHLVRGSSIVTIPRLRSRDGLWIENEAV